MQSPSEWAATHGCLRRILRSGLRPRQRRAQGSVARYLLSLTALHVRQGFALEWNRRSLANT
jgi:hypothetical protein